MNKIIIGIIAIILNINLATASPYNYEKQEIDKHVIHIVTLDPKFYEIELIKSNDGALGRETVSSMATRSRGEIAINAGFFEIGGNEDGKPSKTLVVKGHKYNIKAGIQPLVIIKSSGLSILKSDPKDLLSNNISMVTGTALLNNGIIADCLSKKDSTFITEPHARTALGLKPDGTIVIVIAEHSYLRDLTTITAGEAQSMLRAKGKMYAEKYHHNSPDELTLKELKHIIRAEYTPKDGTQGLTMMELAKLMDKLGCKNAVNLDGGGSSTLWIKDKIVNYTIGDKDEGNGLQTIRAVSDAIIFRRK